VGKGEGSTPQHRTRRGVDGDGLNLKRRWAWGHGGKTPGGLGRPGNGVAHLTKRLARAKTLGSWPGDSPGWTLRPLSAIIRALETWSLFCEAFNAAHAATDTPVQAVPTRKGGAHHVR